MEKGKLTLPRASAKHPEAQICRHGLPTRLRTAIEAFVDLKDVVPSSGFGDRSLLINML
jgi:hypothetical protein